MHEVVYSMSSNRRALVPTEINIILCEVWKGLPNRAFEKRKIKNERLALVSRKPYRIWVCPNAVDALETYPESILLVLVQFQGGKRDVFSVEPTLKGKYLPDIISNVEEFNAEAIRKALKEAER